MAFPTDPITTPDFTDDVLVDAATMDTKIADRFNALRLLLPPDGWVIAEQSDVGPLTLTSVGVDHAGTAHATFTLSVQQRVRITAHATITPGTVTGATYRVQSGYNTGSSASIGSVTKVGANWDVPANDGTTRNRSGRGLGTALLTAGTYTAYAAVQRLSGGDNTDSGVNFYTLVEFAGFD